jgi:hypothetical protein
MESPGCIEDASAFVIVFKGRSIVPEFVSIPVVET